MNKRTIVTVVGGGFLLLDARHLQGRFITSTAKAGVVNFGKGLVPRRARALD